MKTLRILTVVKKKKKFADNVIYVTLSVDFFFYTVKIHKIFLLVLDSQSKEENKRQWCQS